MLSGSSRNRQNSSIKEGAPRRRAEEGGSCIHKKRKAKCGSLIEDWGTWGGDRKEKKRVFEPGLRSEKAQMMRDRWGRKKRDRESKLGRKNEEDLSSKRSF